MDLWGQLHGKYVFAVEDAMTDDGPCSHTQPCHETNFGCSAQHSGTFIIPSM